MPPASRSVPRKRAGAIGDGADGVAHVLKHALSELDEAFGRGRHAHVPADAQKQRLAEFFLEQGNLPADRRLRHVQLPSARGERSGVGNRLQNFKLTQVHMWWRITELPSCGKTGRVSGHNRAFDSRQISFMVATSPAGARMLSSAIHQGIPGSVPTC